MVRTYGDVNSRLRQVNSRLQEIETQRAGEDRWFSAAENDEIEALVTERDALQQERESRRSAAIQSSSDPVYTKLEKRFSLTRALKSMVEHRRVDGVEARPRA